LALVGIFWGLGGTTKIAASVTRPIWVSVHIPLFTTLSSYDGFTSGICQTNYEYIGHDRPLNIEIFVINSIA
jgi:hypothetical protein